MKRIAVLLLGMSVLAVGWAFWPSREQPLARSAHSDSDVALLRARTWLAQRRLDDADRAARQILAQVPQHPGALLIAGEVAMRREQLAEAERLLAAIGVDDPTTYRAAQLALGEIARVTGRMSEAEIIYRRILASEPHNVVVHRQLGELLNLAGRRRDALPHLLAAVAQMEPTPELLTAIGDVERLIHNAEYLQNCRRAAPHDPLPMLALARVAMSERRWSSARRLLEQVIRSHPQLVEAQVQLGVILHETGDGPGFLSWHARLPAEAEDHPDLWALRGSWQRDKGLTETALRCYWEAVRRDIDHRVAVYQLAQLCQATGRQSAAEILAQRATRLQELADLIEEIRLAPTDGKRIATAARLTRELGRWWEARGWAQLAANRGMREHWVAETLQLAESHLHGVQATSRTVIVEPALVHLNLGTLPLPSWPRAAPEPSAPNRSSTVLVPIRFADVAPTVGLHFQYFNAHDPTTEGMRMFEFTGGGVAVLDFDRDGWPDLYCTQGCAWPPQPGQRQHLDDLFRNRAGRQFQRCTTAAGIIEDRYSQGVSVGDFNEDGFPDLYVANIGCNSLWINHGDGTFSNATTSAGLVEEAWTTSCAVADLDGDGLADLFDVNYLQGESVFTRICQRDGHARACMPTVFEPARDALWRNTGDGGVADASAPWRVEIISRTGLGVVVADWDASGEVDVFVANDALPNSFYPNLAASIRERRPIRDQAVLSGLAFDRDGRAQACMGVACGDADGDGHPDLFVTNYYDESNTLYHQQAPQLFVDATAQFGLRAPSYKLLGFGTQFLDADLDGWEDLVLVNGHVDDFTHEGIPYQMRPQFFVNRQGTFVERPADSLGPWFAKEQLGRSLATLDWNRDGWTDFAVSHLDTPLALVTNQSHTAPGRFVALQLVAVHAQRDAIGSIVRTQVGDRILVRHLSAGDGYQASNERKLTLGLGSADWTGTVEIHWPGGRRQMLHGLQEGRQYVVVEGVGAWTLP